MKFNIKTIIIGVIFLLIGWTIFAITLESISEELVCQCGCGLVLNNCNHIDCGVAVPMRNTISEKIEAGETKEQIVEYFVSKYGEAVLAAPTKEGFNLTAWLFPFIGIAIGAFIIVMVIMAWVKRRKDILKEEEISDVSDSPADNPDKPDKYKTIFENEIKDFD